MNVYLCRNFNKDDMRWADTIYTYPDGTMGMAGENQSVIFPLPDKPVPFCENEYFAFYIGFDYKYTNQIMADNIQVIQIHNKTLNGSGVIPVHYVASSLLPLTGRTIFGLYYIIYGNFVIAFEGPNVCAFADTEVKCARLIGSSYRDILLEGVRGCYSLDAFKVFLLNEKFREININNRRLII